MKTSFSLMSTSLFLSIFTLLFEGKAPFILKVTPPLLCKLSNKPTSYALLFTFFLPLTHLLPSQGLLISPSLEQSRLGPASLLSQSPALWDFTSELH